MGLVADGWARIEVWEESALDAASRGGRGGRGGLGHRLERNHLKLLGRPTAACRDGLRTERKEWGRRPVEGAEGAVEAYRSGVGRRRRRPADRAATVAHGRSGDGGPRRERRRGDSGSGPRRERRGELVGACGGSGGL
ncbi:hypothetical protein ACQJBY_006600 [Aegilops geniculata]